MQDFQTQTYTGTIQYGDHSGDTWYGISDHNHPILLRNITEVVSKPELFEGFQLYVVGGILEGWLTWDIDWTLVGPYEPERIKLALDWLTGVGFKHSLYPDVCYTEELMDLYAWQQGSHLEDRWIYRLSNTFVKNGTQTKDLSNYEPIDGMWRYWQTCPFIKNIQKDSEGHKYKKPIRIL